MPIIRLPRLVYGLHTDLTGNYRFCFWSIGRSRWFKERLRSLQMEESKIYWSQMANGLGRALFDVSGTVVLRRFHISCLLVFLPISCLNLHASSAFPNREKQICFNRTYNILDSTRHLRKNDLDFLKYDIVKLVLKDLNAITTGHINSKYSLSSVDSVAIIQHLHQ